MHIGLISAIRFEEASQRAIPTIGLYYLLAYVEKYEPDVKVSVYRTPDEILAAKPDMVGISSVTENFNVAREWAKLFKEKLGATIVLGGDHISALPHTLGEEFDIGIIGEGEETFLDIARIISGDPKWREKLDTVKGISFHGEKGVVVNERRELIEPMTRIPYPRREKDVWGRFHYCFSSRGCPYNCTFCSPNVIWQHYRPFPAEYVVGELEEIFRDYNPYYLHFFDDLFIGDRDRIKALNKLFRERDFHKKTVFGGHIRADMMDDEMCKNLKGMNFTSGAFGAESGSDRILKFLKAGSSTVEMNQKAIDICNNYGIDLNLSFIIGTPGETEEDIKMTIDFIDKNKAKMKGIEIFIILPYPGTPIWTYCKRRGLVSEDMNWDLFRTNAFFSELVIDENFLYINQAMSRNLFRKYVKVFQEIDNFFNKPNKKIYEFIEKDVPSPIKH
jgi:anaerobic magnesium-protoporphyrin IX monomethyl ester cyclase